MAKDVDFTTVEAQTQIAKFGNLSREKTVFGRASGEYTYSASMLGAKDNWQNYVSFEVVLNGNPIVTPIGVDGITYGEIDVSRLYNGEILYNKLKAGIGGYVINGNIQITYKNDNGETKGLTNLIIPRDVDVLESTYLKIGNVIMKPSKPTFIEGGG